MEGQGFRDRSPEFAALGAEIVGISFDTPAEQKAFAEAQGFGFRLLCDTDRSVGEAYGAKKGPDEQFADFPRRITYLIDPTGVIRRVWEVTDVKAHPDEVLAALRELAG
ncbi:MAG: hypothetical protein C4321_06830 [Chloroflexota bacterium]